MPGVKRMRSDEIFGESLTETQANQLRTVMFSVVFGPKDRELCAPYLNSGRGRPSSHRSSSSSTATPKSRKVEGKAAKTSKQESKSSRLRSPNDKGSSLFSGFSLLLPDEAETDLNLLGFQSRKFQVGEFVALVENMVGGGSYPVYYFEKAGLLRRYDPVAGAENTFSSSSDTELEGSVSISSSDFWKYMQIKIDGEAEKNEDGQVEKFKIVPPSTAEIAEAKEMQELHNLTNGGDMVGEKKGKKKEGSEKDKEEDWNQDFMDTTEDASDSTARFSDDVEIILRNFLDMAYKRALEGTSDEHVNKAFDHAESLSASELEKLMEKKLKSNNIRDDCSKYLELDFKEDVGKSQVSCQNCGTSAKKSATVCLSQPMRINKETLVCTSIMEGSETEGKVMDFYKMFRVCSKCLESIRSFHFLEHIRCLVVRLFEKKLAEIRFMDSEHHMDWEEWVFKQAEVKELRRKLKKFWASASCMKLYNV